MLCLDIYITLRTYGLHVYVHVCVPTYACPSSWHVNKMAGVDWLHGFLKRRNELGLWMPEATSLSRATSFNVTNVSKFFDNFETVICRHTYEPRQIWNLDETGLTTVQKLRKVLTQKVR